MGVFYGIDIWYLYLIMPAFLISLYAQIKVSKEYNKYAKVMSKNGMTGAEAAGKMLAASGISNVEIKITEGKLTDHYNPKDNTINLSPDIYDGRSVAALGIAAHEAGHAIQYSEGYLPIKARNGIYPLVNISSKLAFPLILLGFILEIAGLIDVGIIFFAAVTAFQIITLPVEFNASRRAVYALERDMFLEEEELAGTKKVLSAAALTYVAAVLVSLAQLLRFVLIRNSRD